MGLKQSIRTGTQWKTAWGADAAFDVTLLTMALVVAVSLSACAETPSDAPVRTANAQQATAPGSVRAGWQVFQEKCATCHGPTANGSNLAPNLLPSMHDMGPRRFAAIVLQRYDWGMPAGRASVDSTTRRGLTDEDLRSEDTAPIMPAWADEPRVRGHIADLYAWLTARANGTAGAGEPGR